MGTQIQMKMIYYYHVKIIILVRAVKILQREYRKKLKEKYNDSAPYSYGQENVPSIKLILMIHMPLEYNKNK